MKDPCSTLSNSFKNKYTFFSEVWVQLGLLSWNSKGNRFPKRFASSFGRTEGHELNTKNLKFRREPYFHHGQNCVLKTIILLF